MTVLITVAFLATIALQGTVPWTAKDEGTQNAKTDSNTHQAASAKALPAITNNSADRNQDPGQNIATDNPRRLIEVSPSPLFIKSNKDGWDIALVCFTGTLVVVGAFQILFLWRTVNAARDNAIAARDNAKAARDNADALINSERAWVIAELVPTAAKYGGQWHRIETYGPVPLSPAEILVGDHWKYKLKLTNMGRTPAQIFGFDIRYSCLPDGVRDLPENAGGSYASYRPFEHLLGGDGQAIEIEEPIIDVGQYMQDDMGPIYKYEKTAVFHGTVKYRHMFSTTDDCYADFCYSYKASEEGLSRVGRHTKQRQEKAN